MPTLLDPEGYMWLTEVLAGKHEAADQAEREMRAQVEWAIQLGIHPTHMDTHMGTVFETPALYAAYVQVAHEFHLPFMAVRHPAIPPPMLAELCCPRKAVKMRAAIWRIEIALPLPRLLIISRTILVHRSDSSFYYAGFCPYLTKAQRAAPELPRASAGQFSPKARAPARG